jgi:hypothetical protein
MLRAPLTSRSMTKLHEGHENSLDPPSESCSLPQFVHVLLVYDSLHKTILHHGYSRAFAIKR